MEDSYQIDAFLQLVYPYKYVLCNISKVLRNPSGWTYWTVRNSVFPPTATHVENGVFAYVIVQCPHKWFSIYNPPSTRNVGLYDIW